MQISSRFTIAVHVLVCIETFKDSYKVTSDFLASSVNVNPVVIRRLLQQLKKAGLINVKRGSGGADIEKPLDEILNNNKLFVELKKYKQKLEGKCSKCSYKMICGGCRASAVALKNSLFEEDPLCLLKSS